MRFDLSTLHVEEYCNAQDRALGFKWGREKGKMEMVPSVFRIPGFWSSNREGQAGKRQAASSKPSGKESKLGKRQGGKCNSSLGSSLGLLALYNY